MRRVEGWDRRSLYSASALEWTPPSPNLPTPEACLTYPGIALVEGTNVSVGRGTPTPFAVVGAPWMDAAAVREGLEAEHLDGVEIHETTFVPRSGTHRGSRCRGVRFDVSDQSAFDPVRAGLALIRTLFARHSREWDASRLAQLVGRTDVVDALRTGATLDEVEAMYEPELARYRERRAALLREASPSE